MGYAIFLFIAFLVTALISAIAVGIGYLVWPYRKELERVHKGLAKQISDALHAFVYYFTNNIGPY